MPLENEVIERKKDVDMNISESIILPKHRHTVLQAVKLFNNYKYIWQTWQEQTASK